MVVAVLAVAGLILLAFSVPVLTSQVIAHEVVVFRSNRAEIGPFHLEGGFYSVYIEDYFPGFDGEDQRFEVAAISEDGDLEDGWTWGNLYDTRNVDGVVYEHAGGFDNLPEGNWTFTLETYRNSTTDDELDVLLVRDLNYLPALAFGAGVVCIAMAAILAVIVLWGRGKNAGSG